MPDHYFTPHLEYAPTRDPAWIGETIQQWERQGANGSARIVGSNGPLPAMPPLVSGLVEHRSGRFADADEDIQYRLRLEVTGTTRRRVHIGLWFAGPGLPNAHTRGGGELIGRLGSNWQLKPVGSTFPSDVREVTTKAGVRELFDRLMDKSRVAPVVLVTRRSRSEEAVTDPERLNSYLRGMAEVWSVPQSQRTYELAEEFVSRGLDQRWNCYDGGIRLYRPGLDPTIDALGQHPLVLVTKLLAHDDPTLGAAAWTLGAVSRALGVDAWRSRWREEVSEGKSTLADLDGLRGLRARLPDSSAPVVPAPAATETAPAHVESIEPTSAGHPAGGVELRGPVEPPRDADRADAPVGVEPSGDTGVTSAEPPDETGKEGSGAASPEANDSEDRTPTTTADRSTASTRGHRTRLERGLDSLREAFGAFANLEELLEEVHYELKSVSDERDLLALERDELSQDLQDLEQERADEEYRLPSSVDRMLAMFDELGGQRLRVTKYARRKAEDSKYSDRHLLGRVLAIVLSCGPDFGAVQRALESAVGRQARARPKESKQTMAKFGDRRSFPLDGGGTKVSVEQHITLGHGARNPNETLQLYWRHAPDGATEIVYAGPHLPTVSANT